MRPSLEDHYTRPSFLLSACAPWIPHIHLHPLRARTYTCTLCVRADIVRSLRPPFFLSLYVRAL